MVWSAGAGAAVLKGGRGRPQVELDTRVIYKCPHYLSSEIVKK